MRLHRGLLVVPPDADPARRALAYRWAPARRVSSQAHWIRSGARIAAIHQARRPAWKLALRWIARLACHVTMRWTLAALAGSGMGADAPDRRPAVR